MFRRFFYNPKAEQFQTSKKIKDIIEDSKVDPSDFSPNLFWDPKNPPKPIWIKETIEGTYGSDVIHGTNDGDYINGNSGSDLIYGNDGDDTIYGDHLRWDRRPDSGVDTVWGGNGNDTITAEFSFGENGNDELHSPLRESAYLNGGNGDDDLWGDTENDILIGGAGDDDLRGKGGGDRMTGGRGADKFVVGHQGSFGDLGGHPEERDVIVDFRDQGDHIEIPAVTYNNLDPDQVNLDFNHEGVLIISVHDERVSGIVAEVHGLDAQQPIEDQIEWISSASFKLIA